MCGRKINYWLGLFISIIGFDVLAHAAEPQINIAPIQLHASSNTKKVLQVEKQHLIDIEDIIKRRARFYRESEDISKTAKIATTQLIEEAQLLAEQVKINIEKLPVQEKSVDNVKIADNKGINIKELVNRYYTKYQESKAEHESVPELMVFASFSMPEKGLKELGEQASKAGGVLVFRGMYNNSLTATFKKMQQLSEKGIPAIIHPGLFKKFNIKTVPVIALVDKENAFCLKKESACTPVADLITGNVTLFYALSQFEASGDYSLKAKVYLTKARGKT